MRIKRLQLAGFKSCMERTTLEFPRGITGIVGPNGCGKSNIVDALRWVLGEQSAKHLRGEIMEDVIFAGNDRFSPLGAAEVSITLDNEGPLPTIAADASDQDGGSEPSPLVAILQDSAEIEVTRRLFRSGESEYLINGKACRLRDITELFLGTGVGTKAYSIIEQGRVGQIVNAKPEELRLFIEEAAGTTLYRARKLAAERKIERTRNNLLRVSDIVTELDRQASSLRRQVRGAVRYKELKAEEESLDAQVANLRIQGIVARVSALSEKVEAQRTIEARTREEARVAASERDRGREHDSNLLKKTEEARKTFYENRGRLTAVTQERQFLEQRAVELAGATEAQRKELVILAEKSAGVEKDVRSASEERSNIEAEISTVARRRADAEAALAQAERAFVELERDVEGRRDRSIDLLAEQARLDNEASGLARQRDAIFERLQRLREEGASLGTVTEQLSRKIAEGRGRLDEVELEIGSTAGGKESAARQVQELAQRRGDAERFAGQRRADVASLGSRYESLRELNDSFAGYAEGVRSIMREAGENPAGNGAAVVADVLDIDHGFERAVAAILADRLQCVVVEDPAEGVRGAEYLRATEAGRASFFPRHPREALERETRGPAPEGTSWLLAHVRARDGFEATADALLAGVAVAPDLRAAAAAWENVSGALSFVTHEGDVIEASGVVTGGSGKPGDEAILARKAELRGIRIKLVDAEVKERDARAAFESVLSQATEVSASLASLDRQLHELTVKRVTVEGELELQRQNLVRTEGRGQSVKLEAEALVAEEAEVAAKISGIRASLDQLAKDRNEIEARNRELVERKLSLERSRDDLRAQVASERVKEAEFVQRLQGCHLRLQSLEDSSADLVVRRSATVERLDRDAAELETVRCRLAEPTLTLEALQGEVGLAEQALRLAESEVTKARSDLIEVEKRIDALSQTLEGIRDEKARLDLAIREGELERSSIEDGLRERLGLTSEELQARQAPVESQAPVDVDSLVQALERVRAGIRRLGVVNVGAVNELEDIDKRLEELSSQKVDLERSMEDLRGTIARLNKMSRQRFKDTFDRVDEIFRQTFPRLFHGGKAWISLTDESNLLETGVEIFVQPPGKKLGNINLMSGGEKALTAVSLIFSLFLYKPSPFCVLDEVDAPLDDANIGRFARMVLEMSGRSQFLLITHNKKTMESCNTLYGVTMQEPGVSKIVSVEMSN